MTSQNRTKKLMSVNPTLRYLVRSYVTNPTTMSAMTDIPAKTPNPMGRTDNVFPGRTNAAAGDVELASAAAAVAGLALAESAVPLAPDAAAAAALPVIVVIGYTNGFMRVPLDKSRLDTLTLTDIAGAAALATDDAAEPDALLDAADEPAATAEEPVAVEAEESVVVAAKELEAVAAEESEVVVADESVAVVADEAIEVVEVDEDEEADVVVSDDELDEPLEPDELLDPEEPDPAELLFWEPSREMVHDLTSCTAAWPLLSVIGVRVITHFSTMVPAGLYT